MNPTAITIEYRIKSNYGKDHFYAANETAKVALRLTSAKTLSRHLLATLAALGIPSKQVI